MGPGYSFDRLYTDSVWFDYDIPIFSSLIVGFGIIFSPELGTAAKAVHLLDALFIWSVKFPAPF
ncbi:hypothetical protein JCM17207_20730 [Faecalibacterium gallinarum]|uniref:Uncharacterized protein n=1 Tax=Faecalibacterium gallinarum TaxID=2903556 RepID=A0AA37J063_9FIRM|nr:hypothetical protein JCM17207_20730 [Faecalibacterium gallinarum]